MKPCPGSSAPANLGRAAKVGPFFRPTRSGQRAHKETRAELARLLLGASKLAIKLASGLASAAHWHEETRLTLGCGPSHFRVADRWIWPPGLGASNAPAPGPRPLEGSLAERPDTRLASAQLSHAGSCETPAELASQARSNCLQAGRPALLSNRRRAPAEPCFWPSAASAASTGLSWPLPVPSGRSGEPRRVGRSRRAWRAK